MAVGIPINSLQDMLLLKQTYNNPNNGLQGLMNGVASSIMQKQEEAKLKKQKEEQLASDLKTAGDFANTNGGKMKLALSSGKSTISVTPLLDVRNMPVPENYELNPNYGYGEKNPYVREKQSIILGGSLRDEEYPVLLQGMAEGLIDPESKTYTKNDRTKINLEAVKQGINLNELATERLAVKKFVTNKNSTQQIRLREAIDSVQNSVVELRDLNADFKRSGFNPANKAELMAVVNGVASPELKDAATKYLTQVNLIADELGQVFMGGNSPTDRALKIAQDTLKTEYGFDQMNSVLNQIDKNLSFRLNSLNSSRPYGIGGEITSSPYFNKPKQYSQEDLQATAAKYGMTVEEVIQKLGDQ